MRYWWALLIVAIFLIIPGLLFAALGVSIMGDEPEEDDPSTEEDESDDPASTGCLFITMCVPIFWLPALVLIILAIVGYKDTSKITHMADVMNAHDSMHVTEAARAMNVTPSEAKKLMSKCINRNKVDGRMKKDYYYSPAYLARSDQNLRRREFLIDMVDILKAYRRVPIKDFAERIGREEQEAERIILECLEDGLVRGYISRRSRVFFTMDYLNHIYGVQVGWKCVSCGSNNHEVILPGEIDRCPYCGSLSTTRGIKPPAEEAVKCKVLE